MLAMNENKKNLLFQYQETRRHFFALKAQIAELDSASNFALLKQQLATLKKEMASCQEAISLLKKEIKRMEDENSGLVAQRRQSEESLYGGKVSSPKELTQLERKIKEYKELEEKNEDRMLADLIAVEEKETELGVNQQKLNKLGAKVEKVERKQQTAKEALLQEAEATEKDLKKLESLLPAELKARFDKMAAKLRGIVITPVQDGACGACHCLLSPAIKEKVQKNDDTIYTCENCGRIIFMANT